MVSPRRRSQPIYELLVWRTYEPDPLAWLPGDALLAMNGLPIIVLSLVGQIATRMHNDGFVHGDLRAADALYGKTHTGFDSLGVRRGWHDIHSCHSASRIRQMLCRVIWFRARMTVGDWKTTDQPTESFRSPTIVAKWQWIWQCRYVYQIIVRTDKPNVNHQKKRRHFYQTRLILKPSSVDTTWGSSAAVVKLHSPRATCCNISNTAIEIYFFMGAHYFFMGAHCTIHTRL